MLQEVTVKALIDVVRWHCVIVLRVFGQNEFLSLIFIIFSRFILSQRKD